jgi:hypothetical protein
MKSTILDLPNQNAKQALDMYSDFIRKLKNIKRSREEFLKYFDVFYEKAEDIPKSVSKILPKSYLDFVKNCGIFSIGDFELSWSLKVDLYQPNEIISALDSLKEQLEADSIEEVSESIGVSEKIIGKLKHILLFMRDNEEDSIGFDRRTVNSTTSEMSTVLFLQDDSELEYLAAMKVKQCNEKGFDSRIFKILNEKLKYIMENEIG